MYICSTRRLQPRASVTCGLQSGVCLLTRELTARKTDWERTPATANTSVKFNLFSTTAINCRPTCGEVTLGRAAEQLRRQRQSSALPRVTGPRGGNLNRGRFTDRHVFLFDLVCKDPLSVKRLAQLALIPLFWSINAQSVVKRETLAPFFSDAEPNWRLCVGDRLEWLQTGSRVRVRPVCTSV